MRSEIFQKTNGRVAIGRGFDKTRAAHIDVRAGAALIGEDNADLIEQTCLFLIALSVFGKSREVIGVDHANSAFAAGHANEVKLGIILGFTGPIESLTPSMADGAELAMAEVTESGLLLDGATVTPVRADSTCIDAGAATAAAERLVTADGVNGIMGADCSGVTGAILNNVAVANGVVMISPSATSPVAPRRMAFTATSRSGKAVAITKLAPAASG